MSFSRRANSKYFSFASPLKFGGGQVGREASTSVLAEVFSDCTEAILNCDDKPRGLPWVRTLNEVATLEHVPADLIGEIL